MACNYADGLSPYENKGKLGLDEIFDSIETVKSKVNTLGKWILESKHVVFHTGAGISTSAGIPDFRGPNGVWTLESKGIKPSINVSFDEAAPTKTHMALVSLVNAGLVHFVVSQNIDGLHLRSGLSRNNYAELHGNMFVEQCNKCRRQFVRKTATTSVGEKCLGHSCPVVKSGRPCRGKMHDVILDWEASLPESDLDMADYHSSIADLNVCLGTTLQIVPSGNLPLKNKKWVNGKLAICNLQPTKHDKKADLIIHSYVDDVMVQLLDFLKIELEPYSEKNDPTKKSEPFEWTIPPRQIKEIKTIYNKVIENFKKSKSKQLTPSAKKLKLENGGAKEIVADNHEDLKGLLGKFEDQKEGKVRKCEDLNEEILGKPEILKEEKLDDLKEPLENSESLKEVKLTESDNVQRTGSGVINEQTKKINNASLERIKCENT